MNKHTPAPWVVKPDYFDGEESLDYLQIKSSDGHFDIARGILSTEDAHLIAAAPDLLVALEGLEEYVSRWYNKPHGLLKEARAAIAKAKGE